MFVCDFVWVLAWYGMACIWMLVDNFVELVHFSTSYKGLKN